MYKDRIQAQESSAQRQMQHGTATNAQFLNFMRDTSSNMGNSGGKKSDLQLLLNKVLGGEEALDKLKLAGVNSVTVLKGVEESDAEFIGVSRYQLRALLKAIE